jgi:hypothetical protein
MADRITIGGVIGSVRYDFILSSFGLQRIRPQFFKDITVEQAKAIKYSSLGTMIFDNVILCDSFDNPTLRIEIDAVLIDATLPKIIQKTQVTGRRGRVKEYIADDDWKITLRGALFSDQKDAYPEAQVRSLTKLCRLSKQVPVVSKFLNDLCGVDSIVIEEFSLTQRSGMMNAQAFEIQASSDLPYELQKIQDNV